MTSLHPALENVHRLQPLRVLLAGTDRRFIRVTSFLLARRGYDVAASPPSQAVDAATRHRADVVLLEGVLSRAAAARRVAQLRALAATPGVVVVTERVETLWNGLPTVEKWTPLEELVQEIEAISRQRPPSAEVRPHA
jgi:DNA-binding response OmpR family regulator